MAVRPSKKERMKHIGLFEGIGGFSIAARQIGWETVAWCEWNEFNQQLLKHHFPEAEAFGDIVKSDFTKYANTIDVLTGGFPCQPFSQTGKQLGEQDERYLFPEMLRAIREIKPRWVVAENVYGIVTRKFRAVFEEICSSLEAEGYEVQPIIIPASAIGAWHERYRVWFVAYAKPQGLSSRIFGHREQATVKSSQVGFEGYENEAWQTWNCTPELPLLAYGLSEKLDEPETQGLGNAIVPGIALEIFRVIAKMDECYTGGGVGKKTKGNEQGPE